MPSNGLDNFSLESMGAVDYTNSLGYDLIVKEYSDVFEDKLGMLATDEHLEVDSSKTSAYCLEGRRGQGAKQA